jgi:hypothetical protein
MKNISLELDEKAKTQAKDFLSMEGALLATLIEMKERRVFAELNYSGIFDYCERALRFSRAQSYYFKSVAEKSMEVPEIRAAIQQGELTLSEARRIVPVVTRKNFQEWKERAQTLPQVELERAVTQVNPAARRVDKIKPVTPELAELRASVDSATEQNIKALQDLLSQKTGRAASISDVIKWATQVCRQKHDPMLKKLRVVSLGNTSPVMGRQAIRPLLKTSVYQRDERQCCYVDKEGERCRQRRWLHLHHIREAANGGQNTLENLKVLCHAHHRHVHRK